MCKTGHRAIAANLRTGIQAGTFPAGSFLPHQETIAQQWGVNLHTVRKAVNLLHAEGLVTPMRGQGTQVRDRNVVRLPITRYRDSTPGMGPWETACAAQGLVGVTDVTEVGWIHADQVIAGLLEVTEGTPVIRRRNRMRIGDRVRQVQETWLPPHVAEGNALAKQSLRGHTKITGGIYGGLVAAGHTPATGVEIVFSRMPTRSEAEIMGLRLGSPVTDVRRTTRDSAGVVIVHTHLVLSGDHVQLVYPQTL